MNEELAGYFFAQVLETFSFLVSEHGFSSPTLKVDDAIHFAYVTFMGRNLAVELVFDERESDVTCKISRVIGGRKTSDYSRDENGRRVREALSTILTERGVREPLFTRSGHLEFHDRIRVTLGDLSRMLRKHGEVVLSDSPDALECAASGAADSE